MADNDPNVMQAQLGLMGGGGGSMAPFGMPTPMPVPPPMKHPGDAARDAVQMTQTMAMSTMQSAQAVNYASMGTPGGGFGGGGGMGGGGGWGMGSFANQYRQNMAGIQQQQLNPWMAGSMASIMGSGGYQSGMMPSPIQMTQPSMGIYRPPAAMPMGQIPPMPPMPLFPTPFTPNMPNPMFSTPFDYNMQRGELRGIQHTAAAMSIPGVAARGATAAAGGWAGAGLGANLGARFGAGGAAIGAAVGGFAGMMGAEHFLGAGVQNLADQMNPLDRMARHTAQIRGMSQEFVVAGSGLSAGGRGFNMGASARVGRQLNDMAADSGFQRQTGSQFSSQDLMKITQTSGQQGLLDLAQNPEQMVGQVKQIAKALTAFMKLAGEPDVTEALKQMGQMRQMGLSLGETIQATQHAKQFARMGGTSVKGIMESGGLPGAMIYQQQGLSAGLGLQVGMGAMGMARQAVASGAFTSQQLAMLGGTQGVAQHSMESSAAMLKQPLLAAAMSGMGSGGTWGLNAGSVRQFAQGKIGIEQMATMGVENLNRAVGQHGVGALGAFQMQQSELQDQFGRAMGPVRMGMMGLQQGMKTAKFLGLSGAGGLYAGFKAQGFTDEQARAEVLKANSPEYFQNIQKQINVSRMEDRATEHERREREAPGLVDKLAAEPGAVRSFSRSMSRVSRGFGDLFEGGAAMLAKSGAEGAARRTGQTILTTSSDLLSSSPEETRRMRANVGRSDYKALEVGPSSGADDALFHTAGGRAVGRSAALGSIRDFLGGDSADLAQYRKRKGGLGAFLGGGNLEMTARMTPVGQAVAALSGGFVSGEDVRADIKAQAGVAEATNSALNASNAEKTDAFGRLSQAHGKEAANVLTSTYEEELAKIAREKSSIFGDAELTKEDKTKALSAARAKAGIKGQIKLSDVETVSTSAAKVAAGAKGGAFNAVAIADRGNQKSRLDDIMAVREGVTESRMKATSFFGAIAGLGEASEKREATGKLYAGDAQVGLLTSLIAATLEDPDDQDAKKALAAAKARLPEKDRARLISEAESRAASAGGSQAHYAAAGKSYAKEGDALAAFKKDQDVVTGSKELVAMESGKRNLVKDKSLLGMSEGTLLATLAKDPDKLAKADRSVRELAVAYGKAKTPEEKAKLEGKMRQLEFGASTASEQELLGGALGKDEKKHDLEASDTAATAAAAGEMFPQAVDTFKESIDKFADTMKNMGYGGSLPNAVNGGDY